MTARIDFLVFLLIAAGLASAAMNIYLMRHRAIVVNFQVPLIVPALPATMIRATENPDDADAYTIHAFPRRRPVCSFANTICWIRI